MCKRARAEEDGILYLILRKDKSSEFVFFLAFSSPAHWYAQPGAFLSALKCEKPVKKNRYKGEFFFGTKKLCPWLALERKIPYEKVMLDDEYEWFDPLSTFLLFRFFFTLVFGRGV